MHDRDSLGGKFCLSIPLESDDILRSDDLIHILWNNSNQKSIIRVDHREISIQPSEIVTLTFLHKSQVISGDLTSFSFNREFYCIRDNDEEVSCNGIIFFGTQDISLVKLDSSEQKKFRLLLEVFKDEFTTEDKIQSEMLRILLKRLIIKVTRLAKEQSLGTKFNSSQIETIREFNFLVDLHYREKKLVLDYADLLYKSPKTLANLFAKYNQKSPLRIIHERIVLEAKRLLIYTDFTIKQIAFDLGFDEVSVFNKIFKKIAGISPSEFKAQSSE